jgi:hypothetical protein
MVQIEELQNLLDLYVSRINITLQLFIKKFKVKNPCELYWQGLINRIGFLDDEQKIQYSFHGSGCTVEFDNGDIISFDFSEDDSITFDLFKLEIFVSERTNASTELANLFQKMELYKEGERWKLRNKVEGH